MDIFLNMTSAQAAALQVGLLIVFMMGLKFYVGNRRYRLKVPPGDVTNVEFGRATRVQLNAVEDVPVLGMPAWYIHLAGVILLFSRIGHAFGLSGSGGFSLGRAVGTLGTVVVYIAVAGALIVHAFTP
jgi:uncharacterized membrane protein YecN with MAPEG domain